MTTPARPMRLIDPAELSIIRQPKPTPVLLLLDCSESMNGIVHCVNPKVIGHEFRDGQMWDIVTSDETITRMDELNRAVSDMMPQFIELCEEQKPVALGLISFNDTATQHRLDGTHTFAPADVATWQPLSASGEATNLGAALRLAKRLIEDRNETPGRAYRPLVVLVSDGQPTDSWQEAMNAFVNEGRSAKCDRLALMVGSTEIPDAMQAFANGTPNPPIAATQHGEIKRFFRYVSMSTAARSRSQNPNTTPVSKVPLQEFVSKPAPTPGTPAPGVKDDDNELFF